MYAHGGLGNIRAQLGVLGVGEVCCTVVCIWW